MTSQIAQDSATAKREMQEYIGEREENLTLLFLKFGIKFSHNTFVEKSNEATNNYKYFKLTAPVAE